MRFRHLLVLLALLAAGRVEAGPSFVNWESHHVHPIDLTPDGARLLAVNTADNRLEVFAVDELGGLALEASIPVGLDPVSVRARTSGEAVVINRISDSASIVDLELATVTRTIRLGDEPGDVVFAAGRAFFSCGTGNALHVHELPWSDAAPTVVALDGEQPEALATSTDGSRVWCLFEIADTTTVLHHALVSLPSVNPYAGAPNPPPNAGDGFEPPINPDLLVDDDGDGVLDVRMPRSSMILEYDLDTGLWQDDQGTVWPSGDGWDPWTMHGHAMAEIDATTLDVTYHADLLTHNAALAVSPAAERVAIVGEDLFSHVRFEPNLKGRFLAVREVVVDGADLGGGPQPALLNAHLEAMLPRPATGATEAPDVEMLPPSVRRQSIGHPHGVAWAPDGAYKVITGMGSNNLVKTGPGGGRLGLLQDVGAAPTGVVIDAAGARGYVLLKHDAAIATFDPVAMTAIGTVSFHDPTPAQIKAGRPLLYETTDYSAGGDASCASCHLHGGIDRLAWDLGDPAGEVAPFDQICLGGDQTLCEDFHPMKGPMVTQSLKGLENRQPFHWRGDRADLEDFNGAWASLLGGTMLTDEQMADFKAFVFSMRIPPNPYRNIDGSLRTSLDGLPGNPQHGKFLFDTPPDFGGGPGDPADPLVLLLDAVNGHVGMVEPQGVAGTNQGGLGCAGCHAGPAGSNHEILAASPGLTTRAIEVQTEVASNILNYQKDGFDLFTPGPKRRGNGYLHDGSMPDLEIFMANFFGAAPEADRLDVVAYLFSFGTDTHAGVGVQTTLAGAPGDDVALRDELVAIAGDGEVECIAKGVIDGEPRGYLLLGGGQWQSDRAAEVVDTAALDAASSLGAAITYTLVPAGMGERTGLDRDEDGFYDADELDACTSPADATSFPGSDPCLGDVAGAGGGDDGQVDVTDLLAILAAWGEPGPLDLDCSGAVGVTELLVVLAQWGPCPQPAEPTDPAPAP